MSYRVSSVERLIAACRLFLSPDAPEQDNPFSVDFTQDDQALAAMRAALDELAAQKLPPAVAASDPHATRTGKLTTRAKASSSSSRRIRKRDLEAL